MKNDQPKIIVSNRKAFFEFFIEEEFDVGIVLKGAEIKSIRDHRCSLAGSYATIKDNEVWLNKMHIDPFKDSDIDPLRNRKLLLHKNEIRSMKESLDKDGMTLIPLEIFMLRGHAKVRLGLGCGKKKWDKRNALKEREHNREIKSGS